MTTKDIANLIPMTMSLALVADNVKTVTKKKPMKTKDMLGMGMKNIIGVSLIQSTAQLTGGL
jgi:hypothetical protein